MDVPIVFLKLLSQELSKQFDQKKRNYDTAAASLESEFIQLQQVKIFTKMPFIICRNLFPVDWTVTPVTVSKIVHHWRCLLFFHIDAIVRMIFGALEVTPLSAILAQRLEFGASMKYLLLIKCISPKYSYSLFLW